MQYEDERGSNTTAILICLLSVFVSAALLLGMRLYAANLESRVAAASAQIETCRNQNALMERRCAELLSPSSVYVYAKEHLNMADTGAPDVIHVDAQSVVSAKALAEPVRVAETGVLDRFNPFVKQAHAED